MSGELWTLPNLLAGITLLALNAYVLLGGADFGGGVWDLFATGERRGAQRDLIARAIAPIWEANHVWLILVIVLLFTCFPAVFAAIATWLHIPLTLMLIGIVLRGSAFTFRAYDRPDDATQRRWGAIFSAASLITPVLLGVCVGTVASGAVSLVPPASVAGYVTAWLQPFAFAVGGLTLALFAMLAAVYLTVEAPSEVLREDFRVRGLVACAAVFVFAFGALLLAADTAPILRDRLLLSAWALPFQIATGAAALATIVALSSRAYALARIAAAAQVSLILWGWGLASYPDLLPGSLTIAAAAAPRVTLELTLWALGAGAVMLVPSLWYLFRIFKSSRA